MRKMGRRDEAYVPETARQERSSDWYDRVWKATEAAAREWKRRHGGRRMSAICWNALWERVRDGLYGVAWACESRRSHAARVA